MESIEKEYIVYRMPDNEIIVDWNNTTWEFGYPAFPKEKCTELERGFCKGGMRLVRLSAKMRRKYQNQ